MFHTLMDVKYVSGQYSKLTYSDAILDIHFIKPTDISHILLVNLFKIYHFGMSSFLSYSNLCRNIPDDLNSQSTMVNFSSEIVPVRQCRLHYLYATKAVMKCFNHDSLDQGATDLFTHKRLEFHLHFSPNDTTANTAYEELQLEATFHLDLSRLNWSSKSIASGREKIDVLIPVPTKSLGTIVAKISGDSLFLFLSSLLSLYY